MKIVILPSARDDLADGFRFYEQQEEGLGGYFLESLFSDIDSLRLYAGIHPKILAITGCFQNASLAQFTIPNNQKLSSLKLFWIVAEIPNSIAKGCGE
jgi:hypothetical protein